MTLFDRHAKKLLHKTVSDLFKNNEKGHINFFPNELNKANLNQLAESESLTLEISDTHTLEQQKLCMKDAVTFIHRRDCNPLHAGKSTASSLSDKNKVNEAVSKPMELKRKLGDDYPEDEDTKM